MISCVLDFYLWELLEVRLSLGSPRGTASLKPLQLKFWALGPSGGVNLVCQPPEGPLAVTNPKGEVSSSSQRQN